MDLDIGAARAFAHVADLLHFRNAAAALGISQQALSKRISKLEATLGVALLERSTRSVQLTPAGQRFLLPARAALNAADAAVATMSDEYSPIRVDVLAEPLAPTLLVDQLARAEPSLVFERSARRGVAAAITALLNGDVDIAFGRVHGRPDPRVSHSLIRTEPLIVLVPREHPLADREAIMPNDLATYGLWTQAATIASEWSGLVSSFADRFGCTLDFARVDNIDVDLLLAKSGDAGPAFLTASDVANPDDPRISIIDLVSPTPTYPWSAIWRTGETDARIRRAITTLEELRDAHDWSSKVTDTWLPES